MTREDKLYSMRMQELVKVAEKYGVKINKKGAKSVAIEKILAFEAENGIEEKKEEIVKQTEQKTKKEKTKKKESIEEIVGQDSLEDQEKDMKSIEKKTKKRGRQGNLIEFDGRSMNLNQWAKELGISSRTLFGRIYNLGWTVEKAFTTPGRKKD